MCKAAEFIIIDVMILFWYADRHQLTLKRIYNTWKMQKLSRQDYVCILTVYIENWQLQYKNYLNSFIFFICLCNLEEQKVKKLFVSAQSPIHTAVLPASTQLYQLILNWWKFFRRYSLVLFVKSFDTVRVFYFFLFCARRVPPCQSKLLRV